MGMAPKKTLLLIRFVKKRENGHSPSKTFTVAADTKRSIHKYLEVACLCGLNSNLAVN